MKTFIVRIMAGFALWTAPALAQGFFGADDPTPSVPVSPVPPQASLRAATVRVIVAPDHRDWTYKVGEAVRFAVSVTADNEPIDNLSVTYTLGPDLFPGPKKTVPLPLTGLVVDAGTLSAPGFLRCIVTTKVAGRFYRGLATAAFEPEKIVPTQVEPPDFDAFWAEGKKRLGETPIDAQMTLMPEACTPTVDVYHVSFRTLGSPGPVHPRIYGILCEPRAPGKYPAVLKVPGAGVRPYFGDPQLAGDGAIVLEIGIHGIPVNLAKEVYDELGAGALGGYWTFNFDDKEKYYYHRVYLGCVRANDFLTSLPNWDGKNLLVMGASQGGELTMVTAALDPRVTGISVTHPAFCDVSSELHGRAGGWPHPFMPEKDGSASPLTTAANIATATYYDTVNFARRIHVPGYYTWGYNDETCPPTSTFAAYNSVTAPKTLGATFELGHTYTPEQYDAIAAWVTHFLGLKPLPPSR